MHVTSFLSSLTFDIATKEVNMRRPLCSDCQVEFEVEKQAVIVVDYDSSGQALSMTFADEMSCPKCGHKVVDGFGDFPFLYHADIGFAERLEHYRVSHQERARRLM